jgi:hypothetical protein
MFVYTSRFVNVKSESGKGKIMNVTKVSKNLAGLKNRIQKISWMNPVERIHPPNQRYNLEISKIRTLKRLMYIAVSNTGDH